MKYSAIIAVIALPLLAACGDNPDNVPLRGQWQMETRLDSFTLDGMIVSPEAFPPEFARLEQVEGRCGEPMFIDREWQIADINRRVDGECTFDDYTVTPSRVEGSGMCDLSSRGLDFQPSYSVGIDQSEESYRMVVTMQGSVVLPEDGRPHTLKVIAVQQGTRTGDC